MHEDHGPANVRVFGKNVFGVSQLLGADVRILQGRSAVLRIQAEEEYVLIDEMIAVGAEFFFPHAGHHLVGVVVVANHVEKRHFKFIDEAVEFLPLPFQLVGIPRVSLDQVADGDYEFRLDEVDLGHASLKNAGPHAASAIGDDDKLKVVIIGIERGPGLFQGVQLLGNDLGLSGKGGAQECTKGQKCKGS